MFNIDLSILDHPETIVSHIGEKIADVGRPIDWNPTTCSFCRFLEVIQTVDRIEIKESTL